MSRIEVSKLSLDESIKMLKAIEGKVKDTGDFKGADRYSELASEYGYTIEEFREIIKELNEKVKSKDKKEVIGTEEVVELEKALANNDVATGKLRFNLIVSSGEALSLSTKILNLMASLADEYSNPSDHNIIIRID